MLIERPIIEVGFSDRERVNGNISEDECSLYRLRWTGHVARMEEGRSAFKILTGKPTGKRPLGRPRRRWKDNIRMNLQEICINAGNWVDSAQDRDYWRALVNATLNPRVP